MRISMTLSGGTTRKIPTVTPSEDHRTLAVRVSMTIHPCTLNHRQNRGR